MSSADLSVNTKPTTTGSIGFMSAMPTGVEQSFWSVGDLVEAVAWATEIALKVGKMLGRYKMGKHFQHAIEEVATEGIDFFRGPIGEIGQSALAGFVALRAGPRAGGRRAGSCGWGRFRCTWDQLCILVLVYKGQ